MVCFVIECAGLRFRWSLSLTHPLSRFSCICRRDRKLKHTFYDALRQTQVHESTVEALMAEERLLEALRYVRRNRVENIPPTAFLVSSNNHNHNNSNSNNYNNYHHHYSDMKCK